MPLAEGVTVGLLCMLQVVRRETMQDLFSNRFDFMTSLALPRRHICACLSFLLSELLISFMKSPWPVIEPASEASYQFKLYRAVACAFFGL